ncbi:MAG: hypothetical protein V1832_00620 [Nitrospirota bacterium]
MATVGWSDDAYVSQPARRHGSANPPVGGYDGYDQTYFIFEPQVNVSVRIAHGVAMVGGVGYRVIGWANRWQDQIRGVTGTFAIRFGVHYAASIFLFWFEVVEFLCQTNGTMPQGKPHNRLVKLKNHRTHLLLTIVQHLCYQALCFPLLPINRGYTIHPV